MPVNRVHTYNTRLASKSTYFMPRVKTNFGKFNIRFQGAKIWNSIQDDLKKLSRFSFKNQAKILPCSFLLISCFSRI